MKIFGRPAGYSDLAVLDQAFLFASTFLRVTGSAGDIVFENTQGEAQFIPAAQQYEELHVAAKRILTNGTVNGTPRTTTATDIQYGCSVTA